MNINVTNPDTAYASCQSLNNLVRTSGNTLLENLQSNIANLKRHWKGSDATLHINNLISLYEALGSLAKSSANITAEAGNAIVALQEVRRSNGAACMVGERLSAAGIEVGAIAKCEETTEYYCEPGSTTTDYNQLDQISNDFKTFKSNFITDKESLMSNWLEGMNRAGALKCFDDFITNSETYSKYITDALTNLNTAISNISKLQ